MSGRLSLSQDLEHIKAFRAWLQTSAPGWSVSGADVEKTIGGKLYLVFSLLRNGLPVATCECAGDALQHIGDQKLTAAYSRHQEKP